MITNEQAIAIANATSKKDWVIVTPQQTWNGIDLSVKGASPNYTPYIFQIDFRDASELGDNSRLRMYHDLFEYKASDESYKLFNSYLMKEE